MVTEFQTIEAAETLVFTESAHRSIDVTVLERFS